MPTVLHVSPHADDEALGAPATLLLLRRAGWRVVNVLSGLGPPTDHGRRRAEAIDAAARAGFELALADEHDAPDATDRLATLFRQHTPAVVISPWPDDVHPTHEATARATAGALASCTRPPVWWQWGLWADLRAPTLYVPFDADVLADAQHVLAAYTGELARNDYRRLLEARAISHAVLGSERVFGFGRGRASALPYAELLTEARRVGDTWEAGTPRVLDPARPLVG